jgi:hypothetical protein
MQQDTPPVLPTPSVPPTPPAPQEQTFYQPTNQAQYIGSPQEHATPTAPQPVPVVPGSITWEASEYVHTEKGGLWLTIFIAIVVLSSAVAVWFGAWTFVLLIIVMGVTMGVFAFRPPHTLRYTLTDAGVDIAGKLYPYEDFRAFGILEDGAFFTMSLIPIKRFSPAINVYFAEAQGEQIVDMVGDHLPMQHIEPDAIDGLMRRLRF